MQSLPEALSNGETPFPCNVIVSNPITVKAKHCRLVNVKFFMTVSPIENVIVTWVMPAVLLDCSIDPEAETISLD